MRTIEKIVNGMIVIETVMEDSDYASVKLVEQRLAVCYKCEFVIKNESCAKCSCLLQSRTKYVEMFCPEGKW